MLLPWIHINQDSLSLSFRFFFIIYYTTAMLFQFNYQFLSRKQFNITPAVTATKTNNACQKITSPEVDGPVDHVAFVIHVSGLVLPLFVLQQACCIHGSMINRRFHFPSQGIGQVLLNSPQDALYIIID